MPTTADQVFLTQVSPYHSYRIDKPTRAADIGGRRYSTPVEWGFFFAFWRAMSFDIDTRRHSCAHVMASAVAELWPDAKFGVGPPTDNGFYYDILLPDSIGEEDLAAIEKVMKRIRKQGLRFDHREVSIDDAIDMNAATGQDFKVELLELLKERGSTAVAAQSGDANVVYAEGGVDTVSFYQVGDFQDLCRGPHVETTKQIGHFKLLNLAGAYWRGDENRQQMQRIYGLCFETKEQLEAEVTRLEEIKLRDHRRLGREFDIFHISPKVGAGLPLWLPNGTILRDELEYLAKVSERRAGYDRVVTPHITNEDLYYQSGHLPYYVEDMYPPMEIGGKDFYLRPMNCPHHHQVYLSRARSYRDLPLRLAEYGDVYRYEDSGALSGLMRTRGFTQNDAHIYCRADQAAEEFLKVMKMHAQHYDLLGIADYYMRLSLPDLENLDKYVDDPDGWKRALDIIYEAMNESGLPYIEAEGEAAFYGPKIDFIIKSAIGVEYAISTNQLDFLAAERFELTYTAADGSQEPVYVIHRAPLGSHERFIAFLLEHYKGRFPLWLAPTQATVIPVSDKFNDYAVQVVEEFTARPVHNGSQGLRVSADLSSDRMQKKIRNATVAKVPLLLIVGQSEQDEGTVALRSRNGTDHGVVDRTQLLDTLIAAAEGRGTGPMEAWLGAPVE